MRTGRSRFLAAVPELLEQARARNLRIGVLIRQALTDLHHYECPIGLRAGDAWVLVVARKLETPNRYRAHWSLQNHARVQWERELREAVAQALQAASWGSVLELGRRPACAEKMVLQIVRLVASSREFIRDDDNLAFSRKGPSDALKRVGLLKDDRREWLEALPIYQDVAPLGRPLTVFFLWPAVAGLFPQESPDVPNPRVDAPVQAVDGHRNPEKRTDRSRRRVRPDGRAAHAETRA